MRSYLVHIKASDGTPDAEPTEVFGELHEKEMYGRKLGRFVLRYIRPRDQRVCETEYWQEMEKEN
jgi:hypothetical protein